jgi:predicted TIM-barrel fold metal-dependent hydrolase
MQQDLNPSFVVTGGVFVEACSVCFPERSAADMVGPNAAEARWAADDLARSQRMYALVATVSLQSPTVDSDLAALVAAHPMLRGIRQIVNHEPSWPRNGALGDLLGDAAWQAGYAALARHGLSFDLQCNPHQLQTAATIVARHPEVPVVVNHLGAPLLVHLTPGTAESAVYWAGLAALSVLPHVSVKISMLSYAVPDWEGNPLVAAAVARVVDMFGPNRCMFASNWPVEIKSNWSVGRIYRAFDRLVESQDPEAKTLMYGGTARRVYRCPPVGGARPAL